MKKSYDIIASFYDLLARLVYGKTLVNAQLYLLDAVPAGARILIVGGGTGWILDELTKRYASGLDITYIDSSLKMIAQARKRNTGANKIRYVTEPVEEMESGGLYDVVMTPFLLDNFADEKMESVFGLLHGRLVAGGLWLYADFQDTDVWWQKALLKIMYIFFRMFCGVEAKLLADAQACFRNHGYCVVGKRTYMKGFVVGVVYRK